jgi:hypothetical protein
VEAAEWSRRPGAAGAIPRGFRVFPMAQAMWRYIDRTTEDLLPERYRKGPIHFRSMPAVPATLVRDPHLLVLSELRSRPQTFLELVHSSGLSQEVLGQALACLYFASSITMDPRKAIQADGLEASWTPSLPASDKAPAPGARGSGLPTLPASLGPLRTRTR